MLNQRLLVAIIAIVFVAPVAAQEPGESSPLFAEHDILAITITAPMKELLRQRPDDEYLPGTLAFTDADGSEVVLDMGLRTRGNYRRQRDVCPFPPLRVNLKKGQAEGTLFDGQNKLKLVAHCKDKSKLFDQNVIREYLAYRILNLLTDVSYRVRLLRVTYRDSVGKQKDREQYAFFIEHKKEFARRIGIPELVVEDLTTEELQPAYSDLTSLFQYMIGNTDFSPIAGAEGENCCHNSTVFGSEGGPVYSVPYDFDMSGLVDAPYATPNPRFDIRSVKQRLYRGRCMHIDNLPDSVQAFQDNRAEIYRLIDELPQLEKSTRKQIRRFVDPFFEIIDDPKRLDRDIRKKCI
jgi:hypothetical protein